MPDRTEGIYPPELDFVDRARVRMSLMPAYDGAIDEHAALARAYLLLARALKDIGETEGSRQAAQAVLTLEEASGEPAALSTSARELLQGGRTSSE